MNLLITFPKLQSEQDDGVHFPAKVNGRSVNCKITEYVLQDEFGLRDGKISAVFQANREAIEAMAETMIRANPNLSSLCISTGNEDKAPTIHNTEKQISGEQNTTRRNDINNQTEKQTVNPSWLAKITAPIPLWVGWGVNGLMWAIFILTSNHVLEFLMGLACVRIGFVAIAKRESGGAKKLIFVSFGDAIWMFYWAFARPMEDSSGLMDLIHRFL